MVSQHKYAILTVPNLPNGDLVRFAVVMVMAILKMGAGISHAFAVDLKLMGTRMVIQLHGHGNGKPLCQQLKCREDCFEGGNDEVITVPILQVV